MKLQFVSYKTFCSTSLSLFLVHCIAIVGVLDIKRFYIYLEKLYLLEAAGFMQITFQYSRSLRTMQCTRMKIKSALQNVL